MARLNENLRKFKKKERSQPINLKLKEANETLGLFGFEN
jgi:hypothetical protein